MILFLDIDGVLNSNQYFKEQGVFENDNESFKSARKRLIKKVKKGEITTYQYYLTKLSNVLIERINTIYEETNCKIVISSTWRKRFKLIELETLLKKYGARFKLHNYTMIFNLDEKEEITRTLEIKYYFTINNCEKYAILDDLNLNIDYLHGNFKFFKTDSNIGITNEIMYNIISFSNNN